MMNNPIIDEYGTKQWYANGKRHRLDGPAIELADGTKSWYVNDQPHRLDGPAVEYADGAKYWFVNGKELSGPLELLEYGTKVQDLAEYLTAREIAKCRIRRSKWSTPGKLSDA